MSDTPKVNIAEAISVVNPAQLERANAIFGAHWRRPEEEWSPKCEYCKDGECPREHWANKIIQRCMELGRSNALSDSLE